MLEGKVALVTGGGRGIGRAIALKLAAYGAAVAVNYCGSKEKAEEVADLILKNGGKAKVYACNVADFQASKEMTEQVIKDFGGLDILVNNAGITRDNLLMKMSEEEFDMVLNTNLKGTFHTRELASRGITVNAIAPGFVETDMTKVLKKEVQEAACSQIPLGHFGKAEDVAEMAAFLASDKAAYITGQVFCVDGGMSM